MTKRRIYSLPSPTNWVEVQKVLSALKDDLSDRKWFDDTVTVEAWDDEVRFSYVIKEG